MKTSNKETFILIKNPGIKDSDGNTRLYTQINVKDELELSFLLSCLFSIISDEYGEKLITSALKLKKITDKGVLNIKSNKQNKTKPNIKA